MMKDQIVPFMRLGRKLSVRWFDHKICLAMVDLNGAGATGLTDVMHFGSAPKLARLRASIVKGKVETE